MSLIPFDLLIHLLIDSGSRK